MSFCEGLDISRQRVRKACDRCRVKKSKCDVKRPCSRCKADDAICVFGHAKRSVERNYPKGYVTLLEQQQTKLVDGLREMYKILQAANAWPGPALSKDDCDPLTQDILITLEQLMRKPRDMSKNERLMERIQELQNPVPAQSTIYSQHSFSRDSDSDGSSDPNPLERKASHNTPELSDTDVLKDSSDSDITQSPLSTSQPPAVSRLQSTSSCGETGSATFQFCTSADDAILRLSDWEGLASSACQQSPCSKAILPVSGLTDDPHQFEWPLDISPPEALSANSFYDMPLTSTMAPVSALSTQNLSHDEFSFDSLEFRCNDYTFGP